MIKRLLKPLTAFIPPQNFGMVEADLYRSAQPTELNFPFLEKLHLRSIIYLAPDELPAPLLMWLDDQRVQLVHLGEDVGKRSPWKSVSEETVLEALHVLLDESGGGRTDRAPLDGRLATPGTPWLLHETCYTPSCEVSCTLRLPLDRASRLLLEGIRRNRDRTICLLPHVGE